MEHLICDQQDENDRVSPSPFSTTPILTPVQVMSRERDSKSTVSQRVAQQNFRARQKEKRRREQQTFETQRKELEEEKQAKERLTFQLQVLKAENVQLKRRAEVAEECSTFLQESVKTFQRSLDILCAGISSPRLDSSSSSANSLISGSTSPQFGHGNHLRARSFPLVAPPPHIFRYFGNALLSIMTSLRKSDSIRETPTWASDVPNLTGASTNARFIIAARRSVRPFQFLTTPDGENPGESRMNT
jgi:hypothetical protein